MYQSANWCVQVCTETGHNGASVAGLFRRLALKRLAPLCCGSGSNPLRVDELCLNNGLSKSIDFDNSSKISNRSF